MDNIDTAEDQNKLIIQNSIKYLDTLTSIKKLNVPTLKSLYRTKCRLMELRRQVFLPVQKPYQRCQKCFMNFAEGDTSFKVVPCKLTPFAKKIIEKLKKNQILTAYQKAYYKKLQKKFPNGFQDQNQLVLTCKFCEKETKVIMNKPKRQRQIKAKAKPAKVKKASKRKDRFCGLNEGVVLVTSKKKKRKLQSSNSDNSNHTALPSKKLFEPAPITTGTMTNSRAIQISSKSTSRRKKAFKVTKKKENVVTEVVAPILSEAQVKLKKKNLNSLAQILKNTGSNNRKQPPRLKDFLASL